MLALVTRSGMLGLSLPSCGCSTVYGRSCHIGKNTAALGNC